MAVSPTYPVSDSPEPHDYPALAAGLLFSLLIHAAVMTAWLLRPAPEIKETPPEVIEVALMTQATPAPVAAPQTAMPEPTPPTPVAPAPAPPKPVVVPKPKPKPKPIEKPKPEPRPVRVPERSEPRPERTVEPSESSTSTSSTAESAPPAPAAPPRPASPPPAQVTEATYRGPGLHNPPTSYPRLALERQWEGTVVLKVRVLPDGTAGEVNVVSSSGHEVLDEAAVDQVKEWHFNPARRGDVPVAGWATVPIQFKLKR